MTSTTFYYRYFKYRFYSYYNFYRRNYRHYHSLLVVVITIVLLFLMSLLIIVFIVTVYRYCNCRALRGLFGRTCSCILKSISGSEQSNAIFQFETFTRRPSGWTVNCIVQQKKKKKERKSKEFLEIRIDYRTCSVSAIETVMKCRKFFARFYFEQPPNRFEYKFRMIRHWWPEPHEHRSSKIRLKMYNFIVYSIPGGWRILTNDLISRRYELRQFGTNLQCRNRN